ncbi:hypothetical protein JCM3765_002871 [Sporobolomyces pararoseus]
MYSLSRLLLLLGAAISLGVASAQLSIKVVQPNSFDLTTRFLETIYQEKPDAFYPFLRQLQQYQVRPKVTFSDPAFKSSKTLEGKPRPSRYANHNPIFTLLAKPFEAYQALEASFIRARLWRARGAALVWRTSLANDEAVPTLEKMKEVSERREKEIGGAKVCQSWMDVQGKKVCSGEEFWKLVGTQQIFSKEPIELKGSTPELYAFDRLLPATRNSSLPLVVLYAAPTDEAFPGLFDFLHKLAQPTSGFPRLQFALRWKINTDAPATLFAGRYDVKAHLETGKEHESIEDISLRAVAFIESSEEKLSALSQIASSLPLLTSQLAATEVPESVYTSKDSTKVNNVITLNKVKVSNEEGIDFKTFFSAMRTDTKILKSLVGTLLANEELANTILLNADLDLEQPCHNVNSKGPLLPQIEQRFESVNLVEAAQGVAPIVTRGSFIESATDEENDVDPPALATMFLITDLESKQGREQVEQVLKFLDSAQQVRFAFLHRPIETASTALVDKPFEFSSLLYHLVSSKQLSEVYPSELLEFLKLKIGPTGPKRSLNDIWTQDNPITPFLEGGLKDEEQLEGAKNYFEDIRKFVSNLGLENYDEPVIVINGRIVRLSGSVMSSSTLNSLLEYELERRIQPVVKAILPVLTPKLERSRISQAELFNLATSVLSSSGVTSRNEVKLENPSSVPSIFVSNSSMIPMYELEAVLDPVSPFSRRAVPILSALSREGLFTVKIHLVPTSRQPAEEDLQSFYGSSFSTKLQFDEEETFEETESSIEFDGLEEGSTLDVAVEVDGKEVAHERKIVLKGRKQTVVVEKAPSEARSGEVKKDEHAHDEL